MSLFKHASFADRIKHASAARASTLASFQARPAADDPSVIAKAAERRGFHEGRIARRAERERLDLEQREREAEAMRLAEAQALEAEIARQAELEAKAEAEREARRDRLAAKNATLVDQKASRDERYAARKARQKR